MLAVDLKTEGLSEATKAVMELPGIFARARKSALSSVGYTIMSELRNHIEYGGTGWAPLHPLTLKLRKFRSAPPTPLFFLGRFARYQLDDEGASAAIYLGKGYARFGGSAGVGNSQGWATFTERSDPAFAAMVRRHEEGGKVRVTKKTRLVWLSTKIKGKKYTKLGRSGAITGGYFVLRPETEFLTIPKRPIFGPVFNKIKGTAMAQFEQKFWEAITRYRTRDWTAGAKK